jgi:hypothetical protein
VILQDNLELARAYEHGRRYHYVQVVRRDVAQWSPEYARELFENAQVLAVNARVQLSDPAVHAARQHDGHVQQHRVIRRLVGGSDNVIRFYND